MHLFRRALASLLAVSMAFGGLAHAAPQGLIGTEQAAAAEQQSAAPQSAAHAQLHRALDREDLARALKDRGVSTDALRERVNALTDTEAQQMAEQIDRAPAGGDVLGLLFTVFIILLVTDILGLTKVFPFTRPVR
jgi:hypothetical protein